MSTRGLFGFVCVSVLAAASACGGASENDFDDRAGDAGDPGRGGASGAAQGGSSAGTAGDSSGGGTSSGGSPSGGSSGDASTGGSSNGGGSTGGSANGGTSAGGSSNGGSPSGGSPNGGSAGSATGGAAGSDSGGGSGGSDGGRGGTTGQGGSGGRGDDCESTIERARQALAQAQTCSPTLTVLQCQGKVEDLCGCVVPVNDSDSTATRTYLELREAAVECGVPCLAIVCQEPTTAMCQFGSTTAIVAAAQCVWGPR